MYLSFRNIFRNDFKTSSKRRLDEDEEGKENVVPKKVKTKPLRTTHNVKWKEDDNEELVRIVKLYNPSLDPEKGVQNWRNIYLDFQTSRSLDAIRKNYSSQIVPNAEKYNLYD